MLGAKVHFGAGAEQQALGRAGVVVEDAQYLQKGRVCSTLNFMSLSYTAPMGVRGGDSATEEYQRGRLAAAMALSVHTLVPGSAFAAAAKRIGCAAVLFLLSIPAMAATVKVMRQEQFSAAIWGGVFTVLLFGLGMWLISSAISRYTDVISAIEICHDGLRWRKGKESSSALWSDIADVDVVCDTVRAGGGLAGAVQAWNATPKLNHVTIKLHSGKSLVIRAGMLTDIVGFAHAVLSRHQERVKSAQHARQGDVFKPAPARR
jgi:hypothetical protein